MNRMCKVRSILFLFFVLFYRECFAEETPIIYFCANMEELVKKHRDFDRKTAELEQYTRKKEEQFNNTLMKIEEKEGRIKNIKDAIKEKEAEIDSEGENETIEREMQELKDELEQLNTEKKELQISVSQIQSDVQTRRDKTYKPLYNSIKSDIDEFCRRYSKKLKKQCVVLDLGTAILNTKEYLNTTANSGVNFDVTNQIYKIMEEKNVNIRKFKLDEEGIKKIDSKQKCSICKETLLKNNENNKDKICKLECGHFAHSRCLKGNISEAKRNELTPTCKECKKSILL